MSENLSRTKVNYSSCSARLFVCLGLSFFLFFISIIFINYADFFADNIKFLLDDPYIYWILGWILFVISFIAFSVSGINLVQRGIQYFKNKKSGNVISEE